MMRSLLIIALLATIAFGQESARSRRVKASVEPRLRSEFSAAGLRYGAPVFLRMFKAAGVQNIERLSTAPGNPRNPYYDTGATLEIWVQDGNRYRRFNSYAVCTYSGTLGPKFREGDKQTPEGFYQLKNFNPQSSYHLSFNVGYPNQMERRKGHTGGLIMVHGICGSIGCFAMTDRLVEDIYTIVYAARTNGQRDIPIHSFPFPMSNDNLQAGLRRFPNNRALWQKMQVAWEAFEASHIPPVISWTGTWPNYGITARGSRLSGADRANDRTDLPVIGADRNGVGAPPPGSRGIRTCSDDPNHRNCARWREARDRERGRPRRVPPQPVEPVPVPPRSQPRPRSIEPRRGGGRRPSSSCRSDGTYVYQIGIKSRRHDAEEFARPFADVHVVSQGANFHRIRSRCSYNTEREAEEAARAAGHRQYSARRRL